MFPTFSLHVYQQQFLIIYLCLPPEEYKLDKGRILYVLFIVAFPEDRVTTVLPSVYKSLEDMGIIIVLI
jgi:hypothetical protein